MDLDKLIGTLIQAGAPALGSILGSAIGGPVGTVVGGAAGKVLAELGAALGTPATPDAIAAKIEADPGAASVAVAQVENRAAEIMAEAALVEAKRAADNDAREAERGFGAWSMRRTVTTYAVLVILVASFGSALAASLGLVRGDIAALGSLVGHAVAIFMAWNGLVSGGRALADAAKAYRGTR